MSHNQFQDPPARQPSYPNSNYGDSGNFNRNNYGGRDNDYPSADGSNSYNSANSSYNMNYNQSNYNSSQRGDSTHSDNYINRANENPNNYHSPNSRSPTNNIPNPSSSSNSGNNQPYNNPNSNPSNYNRNNYNPSQRDDRDYPSSSSPYNPPYNNSYDAERSGSRNYNQRDGDYSNASYNNPSNNRPYDSQSSNSYNNRANDNYQGNNRGPGGDNHHNSGNSYGAQDYPRNYNNNYNSDRSNYSSSQFSADQERAFSGASGSHIAPSYGHASANAYQPTTSGYRPVSNMDGFRGSDGPMGQGQGQGLGGLGRGNSSALFFDKSTTLKDNPTLMSMAYASFNDQLFCFGGYQDGAGDKSDFVMLTDTKTPGRFCKLTVTGDLPSVRERTTASVVGANIYLFGGYNRNKESYYNDLFVFNCDDFTVKKIANATGQIPEKRCGHSACVIDGKIWIFAGRVKTGPNGFFGTATANVQYQNDLYCYDPVKNHWTEYSPYGQVPSRRSMHTVTAVGKKFYIFGGACSKTVDSDDTSAYCDLHVFDTSTFLWNECETHGTPPTPCYGHTSNYLEYAHSIFFFGGKGFSVTNEVNILDLKTMAFKKYAFAGNVLPARWGHAATLHSRSRVVLYGGRDDTRYWSTVSVVELAHSLETQLIELKPEESAAEILRKKSDEVKLRREKISGLQNEVEDLLNMVTNIGEELMRQRKEKEQISAVLDMMERDNAQYREKLLLYANK